jgi:hypothetical protein
MLNRLGERDIDMIIGRVAGNKLLPTKIRQDRSTTFAAANRRDRGRFAQPIDFVRLTLGHYWPWLLSHLPKSYGELGQIEEAWRYVGEAMTAIEASKETWF